MVYSAPDIANSIYKKMIRFVSKIKWASIFLKVI